MWPSLLQFYIWCSNFDIAVEQVNSDIFEFAKMEEIASDKRITEG